MKPFRITIESHDIKVVVEKPHSDLNIEEVMQLVKSAIIAVGFHPDTVNEYFGE